MLHEGGRASATSGRGRLRRPTDVAELLATALVAAAKPIDQWNRLLVIVKAGRLEVYVNGTAVADPMRLQDVDIRWVLATCSQSQAPGVAEFQRFTVWDVQSLPSLEERARKLTK